jgi:hypothetical protein
MDVTYRLEPELDAEEFIDLLVRSTLAERRPVDDPETIHGMLRHADLILTARIDGRLVAPKARGYYPHIGMAQHNSCWILHRRERPPVGWPEDAESA